MPRYDRGDVILVYYAYIDEDYERQVKVRPAVVLRLEGDRERLVIQVTTTNRSDKLPGIFVAKDSDNGREMGLLHDSFISVTNQLEVTFTDIVRKIGNCPLIDRIDEILEEQD